MICERCGSFINDGDMFCGECGFAVGAFKGDSVATARCGICGNPIAGGELFCSECGAPVSSASAPAPTVGEIKICPNCHAVCTNGDDFCGECGQRLPSMPVSAPTMPTMDFPSMTDFDSEKTISLADSMPRPTPTPVTMPTSIPMTETIPASIPMTETMPTSIPTPTGTVESVPSAESVSGGLKSTFDKAERPMHYEGAEEGKKFFKQPDEL